MRLFPKGPPLKDPIEKRIAQIAKQDDHIEYRPTGGKPRRTWVDWFIGRPLASADAPHQTINKSVGLAVFASDALSSTAYATQEILVVLALASAAAFSISLPLSLAIVLLLGIVTLSYRQTIHAYPDGGGAYIVARENLGVLPSLLAGASLMVDYVLTVAVSSSAGVAQLTSAFPQLHGRQVEVALVLITLITLINLRGVRESGSLLAVPSFLFIALSVLTIGVGLFKALTHSLGTLAEPPPLEMIGAATGLTTFLVLRAFASGTTALTGIEAISNGVTAFKEPRSKNAGTTLVWMSIILGTLFLGITFLAHEIGAVPSEFETVVSQIARTVFEGRGWLYYSVVGATTLILALAANTAFAGFPRLGALIAEDGYLPRQLTFRGSRLVYSYGIIALAVMAGVLIVLFNARVTGLIPLYAIGVFLSFTLSQAGLARHWWRSGRQLAKGGHKAKAEDEIIPYDRHWAVKMVFNAFGSVCTFGVMVILMVTKFQEGAWIVVVALPVIMVLFQTVNDHYDDLARHLTLKRYKPPKSIRRQRVIVPISGVHRGTLAALNYAKSLSDDVVAVHVSTNPQKAEELMLKWQKWAEDVDLVILGSAYRLLYEPLLRYVKTVAAESAEDEVVTVVVPEFIPRIWWHGYLHARAANALRMRLLFTPKVVIVEVPYIID
ncbi:MAG: APC family permease [Anaerolineales bacterium]|nr:APC family permease [Anaerolineales bacterium]MCW5854915.1 APC family permease [Anaerolineales bacterium]